jgi:uncharacterized Zn-binding protein involved in type VI secretion
MPAFILNLGASVLCMHGAPASPTSPNPRVRVAGQPVATMPGPWTIAGCPFNVGVTLVPCVAGQFVTGALRVRVGGFPVLLQDSQAVCIPNGTGVTVVATQTRVRAA